MKPRDSRAPPPLKKDPWHAVSIVGGARACPAVTQLRAKRFLAAEAPRLPLAECTLASICRCTYRHYADRRATLRRAADRGMAGRYLGVEKRSIPSRRKDDVPG